MQNNSLSTCYDFRIDQKLPRVIDSEFDASLIVGGHEPVLAVPSLNLTCAEKGQIGRTYSVIQMLGDTEIVEAEDDTGEYPSFAEAKVAAIDYLEDVISLCEGSLEEIREAASPEHYFGADVVEPLPSATEGNVQYICAGHYQPDPEVQAKPIEWFIGKVVKLRFTIPGLPDNGEYMWVAVDSHRGDELVGTLTNEPHHADLHFGDEVVFRRVDVLVVDGFEPQGN